jgi:ABC-type polysaccharide/polyol phosphate transport system ATPase subunit
MALIELTDVGLEFTVRRDKRVGLKDYVIHHLLRRSGGDHKLHVQALRDINLQVAEGDRLGIIGHNGAGKSSLLRLLAGVYPPSRGRRVVHGQIGSLFDISLGFEYDASGRDNILYRGYLQGETRRSMHAKLAEIAEFSELGDFLDMPVRYYSHGMLVRLAFSVATAIRPEILIVDEVLSAGDLSFQAKARERMQTLMSQARAVVLVSHDLTILPTLCDALLWLDHGQERMKGDPAEVIAAYTHQYGGGCRQAA